MEFSVSSGGWTLQCSYPLKLLKWPWKWLSMAKVKPFFSQQYQNNHYFIKITCIFHHYKAKNMCLCIFQLKLKPASDSSVIFFSIFKISFCQAYCFPWLSMTFCHLFKFHDFPDLDITNSMAFQVFYDGRTCANLAFN